ncbi:uracil-DNA glycosylase [Nostoc sp. CHAB 5834]|nr:uracil-DNA glycosylase [Nostoc sp. CHAB 5834]
MSVQKKVSDFVTAVSALRLDNAFNPYTDHFEPFDVEGAAEIRKANLRHILLAAVTRGVEDLWIGLELGHKGGRRTGLAMTDDTNLIAHGKRFGVAHLLQTATKEGPTKEITAGCVWQSLAEIERGVFLWNVVPVHPHRPAEPLTNRRHTRHERERCLPLLSSLMNLLRPTRIVGIGADSSIALKQSGYEHVAVRHPAYGGKRQFQEEVKML